MQVLLTNDQDRIAIDSRRLKNRLRKISKALGCQGKELSLLIVDDDRIRNLNREYRNISRATDVLSFSQLEGTPGGDDRLLGDVVVSAPTARRQAEEHGLTFEEELLLLVIHGLLHLLGYDHDRSAREAREMKQETWRLFNLVFPGKEPAENCQY